MTAAERIQVGLDTYNAGKAAAKARYAAGEISRAEFRAIVDRLQADHYAWHGITV